MLIVVLLLPSLLDSLRVTLGLPLLRLLAVSVCLVAWLTKGLLTRRLVIKSSAVNFPLLLLGAAAFLSITSPIGSPFAKLYRAASFVYARLFMVFLLVNLIQSFEQLRRALYLVIGVSALSAAIAVWQFWMYESVGLNFAFGEGEQMFRVTPLGTFLRATALGSDPNEIGIILAVASIWCFYLGLTDQRLASVKRLAHYVAFYLLVAGLVVTFSRSALLSLVIVLASLCPIFFLLNPHFPMRRVAGGVGVLLSVAAIAAWFFDPSSILGPASDDILWRAELNQTGLRAALENPLTGVGVDVFTEYDNSYDLPAHNLFIQVAAEMGTPALLVFITLLGSLAIRLGIAVWCVRDLNIRLLLVALTLGYAASIISHLTNPVLTSGAFWVYLGLSEAAVVMAQDPGVALSRGVDRV